MCNHLILCKNVNSYDNVKLCTWKRERSARGNSKRRKKAIKLSFTAPLHSPSEMQPNSCARIMCTLRIVQTHSCARKAVTGVESNIVTINQRIEQEQLFNYVQEDHCAKGNWVKDIVQRTIVSVCNKRLCNCETFRPRNCARKKHLCNAQPRNCAPLEDPLFSAPLSAPHPPPQSPPHPPQTLSPHNHLLQCKQWGVGLGRNWGETEISSFQSLIYKSKLLILTGLTCLERNCCKCEWNMADNGEQKTG